MASGVFLGSACEFVPSLLPVGASGRCGGEEGARRAVSRDNVGALRGKKLRLAAGASLGCHMFRTLHLEETAVCVAQNRAASRSRGKARQQSLVRQSSSSFGNAVSLPDPSLRAAACSLSSVSGTPSILLCPVRLPMPSGAAAGRGSAGAPTQTRFIKAEIQHYVTRQLIRSPLPASWLGARSALALSVVLPAPHL